jgi:hypothetical protein
MLTLKIEEDMRCYIKMDVSEVAFELWTWVDLAWTSVYLIFNLFLLLSVISGSSHHNMVHPQIVDGGYILQIWRVAANVLNKQSQTPKKGLSPSLGVG